MKHKVPAVIGLAAVAAALLTACGGDDNAASGDQGTTGPIKIWYSNNEQEVAWGKQAVAAWNKDHPDQQVTAQEIPAGKSSEEVIGAAITAGTTPCLIYNTAPAAVPQFQRQGGLVDLSGFSGGDDYIRTRTGERADQYKSADGHFYQLPWKSNPVMIFYNKKLFAKAGLDPEKPALSTYADFTAAAQKIVASKAAKYAIYPAPSSEFFQSWFDFYPLYAAESDGKQLVEDGKATFDSDQGKAVAHFWRQLYAEKLAGNEAYNGDAFADGVSAMAIVGPWAISVYKGKADWGVVPVPTSSGKPADQIHTFSDAKNVAMYSSCENKGTAWEFLKFSTSQEQDGKLLELTGQMPLRDKVDTVYADYFTKNAAYKSFADQAARTVEVPNVTASVEAWQTFRNAWSGAVIFGRGDVDAAISDAAAKINDLVKQ